MRAPVRSDDVVALMLPVWGPLLGHTYGKDEIAPDVAKTLGPEVRDVYAKLSKRGPVTAEQMKGAIETLVRSALAPFEGRVPSEGELARLSPLVRERFEDFQRVRQEARLRALAEADPFPEGVVDHKYFDHHLELASLELAEKLITEGDLIAGTKDVITKLKGKRPKELVDGTEIRVVSGPKDLFGRPVFPGGGSALEIVTSTGDKLLVSASAGRLEIAPEHAGRATYLASGLPIGKGASRSAELKQKFFLGMNLSAIVDLARTLALAKKLPKEAGKVDAALISHRRAATAAWAELMIRAEWPKKLAAIAEALEGRRGVKIDGDRTKISIKPKFVIDHVDAQDQPVKHTVRAEGGPFLHFRESQGNRDFGVAIPPLAEGRLSLILVGEERLPQTIEVSKDGKLADPDVRLNAAGNFEADLLAAFEKLSSGSSSRR